MDQNEATNLLDEIKARCKTAKITFKDESSIDDDDIRIDFTLHMPQGRETRDVYILDDDDLRILAQSNFEQFVLLEDYSASINYTEGVIEALLTIPTPNSPFLTRRAILRRLGFSDPSLKELPSIKLKSKIFGVPEVLLGSSTEIVRLLTHATDTFELSLFIKSATIKTHDDAIRWLEQVSNSLLFDIDIERSIHISLLRRRPPRRRRPPLPTDDALRYPTNEYDGPAMSLYWYARSAEHMPLLQFLAFYQSIEYYYSRYFNLELGKRVRSILKNPAFRVERDGDVARIVNILRDSGRSGISERDQLKATIKECISSQEIEDFITVRNDRVEFFKAKSKGISSNTINTQNRQTDLTTQIADRIYEIRCKIVHIKGEHEDGEVELLLPYSKEAGKLTHDVDLVQFVAQKVIIASSKPFVFEFAIETE
ncbi:hypothetical protein SAMN05518800_3245 [Variovorax sp. YR752]|uniref:hypothetical protein n=1 Tax=Variovorax sp. YR752 TaxID=1884383 RepID=UPI000BD178AD|nr:hypothetical protein [Variovorax sp. YR752]SOD27681.1 hypothetical protein SAMN05518800_3245 [Variovorax sp. YR752]